MISFHVFFSVRVTNDIIFLGIRQTYTCYEETSVWQNCTDLFVQTMDTINSTKWYKEGANESTKNYILLFFKFFKQDSVCCNFHVQEMRKSSKNFVFKISLLLSYTFFHFSFACFLIVLEIPIISYFCISVNIIFNGT